MVSVVHTVVQCVLPYLEGVSALPYLEGVLALPYLAAAKAGVKVGIKELR